MNQRIVRLKAQTEHLLDAFIRLRATYTLLEPLIFDKAVAAREYSGKRADGAKLLTSVLFHYCILGLANLTKDRDRRTSSLFKLVEALNDTALLSTLREEYAVWNIAPVSGHEPEVVDMLQKAERLEEAARRLQFDGHVAELSDRWKNFEASSALRGISTMRDKLIAHHELLHKDGQYRILDVGSLGLKVNDVPAALTELQACVDLASLIFRSTSFDFDGLAQQHSKVSRNFWSIARAS